MWNRKSEAVKTSTLQFSRRLIVHIWKIRYKNPENLIKIFKLAWKNLRRNFPSTFFASFSCNWRTKKTIFNPAVEWSRHVWNFFSPRFLIYFFFLHFPQQMSSRGKSKLVLEKSKEIFHFTAAGFARKWNWSVFLRSRRRLHATDPMAISCSRFAAISWSFDDCTWSALNCWWLHFYGS